MPPGGHSRKNEHAGQTQSQTTGRTWGYVTIGSTHADTTPTAVHSRATHLGVVHREAARPVEHTEHFQSPLVFPSTSSCYLCVWQTFPQRPQEHSRTGCKPPSL